MQQSGLADDVTSYSNCGGAIKGIGETVPALLCQLQLFGTCFMPSVTAPGAEATSVLAMLWQFQNYSYSLGGMRHWVR